MANENEKVLKTRLRQKHDIEANWIKAGNASVPFVPLAGEIIIYDDRYVDAEGVEHIIANAVRFKIGNGVDNVNDLAFISFDAILDVGQLPEADIKSNTFYRTAKSVGTYYINIEGELLQFPVNVYYVDKLPETGIETKAENLLTDGYHIYKQKEDNLTYVYSLDDVDNIVKWSAADFLIVDTVEELNGESGIVISESVNSIYTRNSENTDWVQLLSASDAYTKAEVDEITTGLNTRLDEFYTEVLDEENQNSLKNEIPDLYNYVDGGFTNVWDFVNTLDGDVATLYNDKLDKVTEEAQYERVYIADVDGTQTVENLVHDSALKWSIPRRYAHGEVVVGEPTEANHATTKKYVDDAVANASGGSGSVNIVQETGESTTAVMSQKAVTTEIDAQKIALANLEYFVPNENVLADNSAKYRKPVPENACPYAEVKKVGGLTQKSKNLIPFPYYDTSKVYRGVTFTINSNGTIIANGTATEEGSFTFIAPWDSTYVPVKLNGTYTLSGVTDGNSGTSATYYLQLYVDGNNTAVVDKKPVTFTANGNITQLSLFFKVGATFKNTSIMPTLNEGSVVLPYTPYFDGFKDSAVTEIRSEHGNLFNFENVYPTMKGENGKIIKRSGAHNIDLLGGTSGGSTPFPAEYFDKLIYLKAGTYYLYYNFEEEGLTDYTMTVLGVEQSGKTFGVSGSQLTSGKTFKPTKDCYITLRVGEREQVTITNLMITTKPQTDYIPYNPDIITIPEEVQALEGYGIGKSESENNYVDFEKKAFHKGYGKIRLLSTMGGYNAENNWYYLSVGELGVAPPARGVLCNALSSVDIIAYTEADGAYFNPSMSHLLLRKSEFTTQAQYRQWLADNEVYIVEKLATPVVTDVSTYLTEDNIINVEDGVFINAVNANELDAPTTVTYLLQLEVKNKYVPIQQTTSTTALVKQNNNGTASLINYTDQANGYTIPYRNSSGTTRFADPIEEKNPVTLSYANEHYVAKLPPRTGGQFCVYSQKQDGEHFLANMSENADAWAIAKRGPNGTLEVGPPTADNQSVNLKYANEHYVPIVDGTGTVDKVYVAGADGTQKVIQIIGSGTLWGNTIAGRRSNGAVQTVAPEMEADTTTKKYVDNKVERILGTTESVEEAVYYDESKLDYSEFVNGCEYDYSLRSVEMIFDESDFVVDNPIYIKFQVSYLNYMDCYASGYLYKSSDGQIYIGDQTNNADVDAALQMYRVGDEIHIHMYLTFDDSSSYLETHASTSFTISYGDSYPPAAETIPEKLLCATKEVEVYDTVKEAERAQTATTATTASTATKAYCDSNGYLFTTYYTKAPSSNPLSISGNNLQVKYTKGDNTTTSYSVDLSKVNAVSSALSHALDASDKATNLVGYEVPGEIVTFDETALNYADTLYLCSLYSGNFYVQLAKSDVNKDKPIYIRVTEGGQSKDYTIIYSPDNADAEERSPYITAYSSEYIDTVWYENDNYICLDCYANAGYGEELDVTVNCNIPCIILSDNYGYNEWFYADFQEVSLEKIEKFTPAACAKGLLAEDGETRLDITDIKEYIGDSFVPRITTTSYAHRAYVVRDDGKPGAVVINSNSPEANTLVMRKNDGTIRVGTPVTDNDATTKKYVDDAVANVSGGSSSGWISGYSEEASELLVQITCTDGWMVGEIIIPHKPDAYGGYSRSFNYHAVHYADMDDNGYCDIDGIGGGNIYFGGPDYIDQENMYGGGILNGQMVRFSATAQIIAHKL